MSDLVVNIRQIGSYPPLNPITGTETLLVQSGGLGGPYYSVEMSEMIIDALAAAGGPISIGVGPPPVWANTDVLLAGDVTVSLGMLGVAFNAFGYGGIGSNGAMTWQDGPAASFELDPTTGNLVWWVAPSTPANLSINLPGVTPGTGNSLWYQTMSLSPNGILAVTQQVTVMRDPLQPLEVATRRYVDGLIAAQAINSVTSFNGRQGVVTLLAPDILAAGGAPINNPTLTGIPLVPMASPGNNTNQIASTGWVLNEIAAISSGVISWNGRSGVVTFTAADLIAIGGATQTYVNTGFLSLTGGAISGILSVGSTNPTAPGPLGVGGQGISYLTLGAVGANIAFAYQASQLYSYVNGIAVGPLVTQATLTAGYLPLGGGVLTGGFSIAGGNNCSWNAQSVAGTWQYISSGIAAATAAIEATGNWVLSTAPAGTAGATIAFSQTIQANPNLVTIGPQMLCNGQLNMGAGSGFYAGYPGIFLPNNSSYWGMGTDGSTQFSLILLDDNQNVQIAGGTNQMANVFVNSSQGFVLNPTTCIPWAHQTSWNTLSDPRLKTNTEDYIKGVSIVERLHPITFQYNGLGGSADDAATGKWRFGFDAAELQKTMPEMVASRKGKLHDDDEEETDLLALSDTMPLLMTMLNAVKQLLSRVEALETAAKITPPASAMA